jgi:CMP-N-acetylneuraminic acid synthetase
MNILPLITVRKGSSLKDKNIRLYKGKPLLVNCIEKCLKVFGKVVVLSDSEKYAEIAKQSGADVFIDETVGDLEDVTIRMRKYCEAVGYNGRLVLCQCTSPNILLESYQKTFELSKNLLDNEILMSCVEVT